MDTTALKSSTVTFQRRSLSNRHDECLEADHKACPVQDVDPPTYEEVTGLNALKGSKSVQWNVQNRVYRELANLEAQVDQTRKRRREHLDQVDEEMLNFLVLQLRNFLMSFSQTDFRKATFLMIPHGAVDPLSSPCDGDLWGTDEYCQLVRIIPADGHDVVWKSGEDARRLASYLQPKEGPVPGRTATQPSKLQSPPPKSPSPVRRSFFKRTSKPQSQEGEAPDGSLSRDKTAPSSNASMTVKGEEVVFRLENSLGLYETQKAWGLVIRVHVAS